MCDKNTELKIYKKLYEINSGLFNGIYYKAKDRLEYRDKVDVDKKEEKDIAFMQSIANKEKWEYYGTLPKESQHLLKFLEYLIDDKKEVE